MAAGMAAEHTQGVATKQASWEGVPQVGTRPSAGTHPSARGGKGTANAGAGKRSGKPAIRRDFKMPAVDPRALELRFGSPDFLPTPQPKRCSLVIVVAGLPRSSSSTQMAMTRAALEALGVNYTDLGYWARSLHVVNSTFAVRNRDRKRYHAQWARLKPSSIVLYKSHEFSSSLVHFCDHAVVLLTYRCGTLTRE